MQRFRTARCRFGFGLITGARQRDLYSSIYREQLADCACFPGKLVPQVITLMFGNTSTLWGNAVYSVVKG